jgi:16S rRNA (uracil1498-N3)-methyltransferase
MRRFFVPDNNPPINGVITVKGSDARHIVSSLRMGVGDQLVLCRNGGEYLSEIISIDGGEPSCRMFGKLPAGPEPSLNLAVYQAYPKRSKLETIIQKTVELGASEIIPFMSRRCVARPDKRDFGEKLSRLQKIAEEAAKQSGRAVVPVVRSLMTFEDALADMERFETRLFFYENEGAALSRSMPPHTESAAAMFGAEGGFERGEYEAALNAGVAPVWLGARILRSETCPVAVTAILMHITGNL